MSSDAPSINGNKESRELARNGLCTRSDDERYSMVVLRVVIPIVTFGHFPLYIFHVHYVVVPFYFRAFDLRHHLDGECQVPTGLG
jgi:hypothetical protein